MINMNIDPINKKHARIGRLLEILTTQGSATISDLAAQLDVSHMTVRRDLELLEASGKVRLFHGGVALSGDGSPTARGVYQLDTAEQIDHDEKASIARYAASLISKGDIVFFDGGSTVDMIPAYIPPTLGITVVCYSYNILTRVIGRENTTIILLGGTHHPSSSVFTSPESVALLKRTRLTKAFISANAIQPELGVTCSNQFEIETKRTAIESSLKRYLLVDSSKFGNVYSAHFADLKDFDEIITDNRIEPDLLQDYFDQGIAVVRVPVEEPVTD